MKKTIAVFAVAGLSLATISAANAERWCMAGDCNFSTQAQCHRVAARTGGECVQYPARREGQDSRFDYPNQVEPSRPYGANRTQCYLDDGGGRFRPCDQPSNQ